MLKINKIVTTLALLGGLVGGQVQAQDKPHTADTANDSHKTAAHHENMTGTWWAAYGGVEGFNKTTLIKSQEVLTTHSLKAAGYGMRHYLGRNDHSVEAWAFGGIVNSHDRDGKTASVKNPAAGATVVYNWPASKKLPNGFVLAEYVRIFNSAAKPDGGASMTAAEKSSYVVGKLANFARMRVGVQALGMRKGNLEASLFPFVTGQMAVGKPTEHSPFARGYSAEGGLQMNFALISKRNHYPVVEFQAQASMEGSIPGKGQTFSDRGRKFYPATAFYVNISPSQLLGKGPRHH